MAIDPTQQRDSEASYRLQLLWLSAMPKTIPVLFIDEALLPESRQFSSHSLSREATTK
jgi:hypothetical protein